ncbi:MauE/DoxX family redox-associated membrane protein [Flagellimonas algicola]|uniref:Methylamine utilisation protein MauE domain-containing protein n=1 Tax=Flagellimonas algicola TaxID=2583815 RepID=A0ABY2WGR6_9FLAO|nr:MauE/DoxX family redox-associated membrane protein [Allomuricauda algicola]TMU50750.1 hypothetical protein FGG15_18305 [Allomuricauda algicola]
MGTTRPSNVIITLISIAYIILFVYTAVSKLMHLSQFQLRLERMPYMESIAPWVAFGVPFVELVITGLLLIPKYRLIAFHACLGLMTLFTAYSAIVLNFSESIPCSCGGVISAMGWKVHILFNAFFILLALLAIFQIKKHKAQLSKQHTT